MKTIIHSCAAFFAVAPVVQGGVVFSLQESNGDILISGEGSIDLASTTGMSSGFGGHDFNASSNAIGVLPSTSDGYSINTPIFSGDFSFTAFVGAIGGDPAAGFFVNRNYNPHGSLGNLFVPNGYVSNTPLDFTAFISDRTLADLGFSGGSQSVVTWSNGSVTESLTLNWASESAIPEPSSSLIILGICGSVFCFRRRSKR